jgi:O-antigen/teichoic acid export membrane protein
LTQRTLAGVGWSASSRLVGQVASFALSVVLARLLTPADFGLLALTTVFTGFAALFADMGLGASIVHARQLEETHRSSVFWLNVAIGTAMTCTLAALSPAIAIFFDQPRVKATVFALSFTFVLGSFGIVQRALLLRRMNFRALAIVDVVSVWLSGAVAVVLAFRGWGIWSLVVQGLVRATCSSVLLAALGGWRPRLHFRRASVTELFGYSANLAGFTFINYWIRNIDNLLIGKFFGPAALGLYTRAYATMLLPVSQITNVLGSVMFPAFAQIQHDPKRVKRAYLRAVSLIALVSFPAMFGLAAVAHDFILTVYGERWLRSAGLLHVLAIIGGLQSVESTVGWIYRSQGRTDALFRWGIFAGSILIGGIGLGVLWGSVEGVAIGYAIAGVILVYPNFSVPGRYIDMRASEVFAALSRTTICATAMAGAVAALSMALRGWGKPITRLAIEVACGAFLYAILSMLINRSAWEELLSTLRQRRRKANATQQQDSSVGK